MSPNQKPNYRSTYGAMVLLVLVGLFFSQSLGAEEKVQRMAPPRKDVKEFQRLLPKKAPTSDIVLIGKALCSLKRIVEFPFQGTITSLEVRPGQAVKEGDVLARYRLTPEALVSLRRQIQSPDINKDEMDLLELRLGIPLAPGHTPEELALRAPITGHVIWVHPELRPGARLDQSNRVLEVGVMNPMLLHSHVYEEETLRLDIGDMATIQPESRPGWKFKGRVSRISWTPLSLDPLEPSYYEVEFTVDNKDLILREGLRVIIHLFKPLSMKSNRSVDHFSEKAQSTQ